MLTGLVKLSLVLHRVTLALCLVLLGTMFFGQIVIVLLRYLMGVGFLELQDSVSYAFAAVVVLSIPLALVNDRHVRVDVFRERFSAGVNRWIDRTSHLFLTVPVFVLLLWNAWPFVANSWSILEGSRETGGLPGRFLVKTCLVVFPLLFLIQIAAWFAKQSAQGASDPSGSPE